MRSKGILVTAFLVFCSGAALAQTKRTPVEVVVPHWYMGIGAGQTIYDIAEDSVAAPGATSSTLNEGQNRTGYRVFGGYRFHRNVAVEGALTDYGNFTATRDVTAPVPGKVNAQSRIRGASLDLVGILPFDSGFSLFGKLGGMAVQTQVDYRTEGPFALPPGSKTSVKNAEFVVKYGFGLGYAITERIGVRMEYEVAPKVGEEIEGDLKALFFSVQYRF
jgi:opacity protein-like surface antigen